MTKPLYSISTPFADELPKAPIRLGRDFIPTPSEPAAMTPEAVYQAFVELAKNDHAYLQRLAAAFKYAAPFKKSAPIVSMPMTRLNTVEVAIEDKGAPKATKRVRPDREALRFHCTIQVTVPGNGQVSNPDWQGRASFRSPARMQHDATGELMRKKSIRADYRDWLLNEVIPLALREDMLIGCVRIDVPEGGNPHADRQVILIDRAGVEAGVLNGALLISFEGGKSVMARLPAFASTYSNGTALKGGFFMQSRGSRLGAKADWRTGEIQVAA